MVIHHDKIGYGKLSDLNVEFSDEELMKMVAEINAKTEEAAPDTDVEPSPAEKAKRNSKKK